MPTITHVPTRHSHRGLMKLILPAALIGMALGALLGTRPSMAQSPSGWLIHDIERPQPRIVAPAPQALPVSPPSDARVLFDGTDLSLWRSVEVGPARWVIRDDFMESVPDSGKLVSADGFGDIQLHVEWATPAEPSGTGQRRGNSGVFLMGEYEIQILDSYENTTYPDGQAAAIYGQYPPLVNACLPPGEWQAFDIVFRRPRFDQNGELLAPAKLTMLHNGVLVHDNRELWGPTSWLKNRPYESHADRLPLVLQDHGNPIRFRNIWLRELPETEQAVAITRGPHPYIPLVPEDLDRFVGSYIADGKMPLEITRDEDRLFFQISGRERLELMPASKNKFNFRWTAGNVAFPATTEETVPQFEFKLGKRTYKVTRVANDSSE